MLRPKYKEFTRKFNEDFVTFTPSATRKGEGKRRLNRRRQFGQVPRLTLFILAGEPLKYDKLNGVGSCGESYEIKDI